MTEIIHYMGKPLEIISYQKIQIPSLHNPNIQSSLWPNPKTEEKKTTRRNKTKSTPTTKEK